jgi:cob(I)alamin adenosyltransferase
MAEVATAPENRHKLTDEKSRVTPAMVSFLEASIDDLAAEYELPKDFVVPGESQLSAALDVARTMIRRAERAAVGYPMTESLVVAYLNRLSDLAWTMARWTDGTTQRLAHDRNNER